MSVDFLKSIVAAGIPTLAAIASNRGDAELQIYDKTADPDDVDADGFKTIHTLQGKWLFDKSNVEPSVHLNVADRGNYILRSYDTSSEMATTMERATHVKFGSDRHEMRREDTTPPTGTDPVWQIFCYQKLI